jgi:AcrR family transcriptional regulator
MNKPRVAKKLPASPVIRNAKMEVILNCAEREFSARGYSATPLHRIAAAARVNQALINYYFGSKEKLYHAVFLRRGVQLTRERLRLLAELEARTPGPPDAEEIIRCFVKPAIQMMYERNGGEHFLRLQARLQNEPQAIAAKLRAMVYDDATRRFVESFKAALPDIDGKTILWRTVMMIGAYLYIAADAKRLEQLSDGSCKIDDQDEVVHQLVEFLTGGFKYPMKRKPGSASRGRPTAIDIAPASRTKAPRVRAVERTDE